jgi:hypothetical protein
MRQMIGNPMSILLLIHFRESFESIYRNQLFIVSEVCGKKRQMINLMRTTLNDNVLTVCFLYRAL